MAHILHSALEPRTTQTTVTKDDGSTGVVEKVENFVRSVTFMLDKSTPHTLTFLPKGTLITDGNDVERVVGDAETVYHEFKTEEEAIAAYLDGKV